MGRYNPLDYQRTDDKGGIEWADFDHDEACAVLADLSDTGQAHPLGLQRLLEHLVERVDGAHKRQDERDAEHAAQVPREPWDPGYQPDGGTDGGVTVDQGHTPPPADTR